MLKKIAIVISISLVVITGPMVILQIVRFIAENMFALDCHTSAGGSLPLPSTRCGNVLFGIVMAYYVWFMAPVPLVIPVVAIYFLSKLVFKRLSL